MDFALNEEQQEFKDRARAFARDVIRPAARKHDEEESIPWEVIKEARKQGFGTLEAIQRSASDSEGQLQVISAEEFHWGCAGIALAISGSGLAAAIGTVREHDGIHARHGSRERVGPREVADDHLRLWRKAAHLAPIAHQGTHDEALPDGLLDDEASDAAGGTHDEHSHARLGHDPPSLVPRNAIIT